MSDAENPREDLVLDPAMLLGVWANGTSVMRRHDEFMINFLRDIPELPRSVLVARALIPPAVAFDLRDQLEDTLRSYTDLSMPGEPDVG